MGYEDMTTYDEDGRCIECGANRASHVRVGCPANALLVPDWD